MTTTAAPKPHVIVRDGVRVPWVAQWTDEPSDDPVQPYHHGDGIAIRYADEQPDDRHLGVLWLRSEVDRAGEPQFAQFNVHRQRQAMLDGLCQVCARPAGGSWVIPAPEPVRSGLIRTSTPPTCADCVQVARRLCPQLKQTPSRVPGQRVGGVWLNVKHCRPYAVWGDIVEFADGKVRHYKGELALADPRVTTNIIGRQIVMEIYDYRKVRE